MNRLTHAARYSQQLRMELRNLLLYSNRSNLRLRQLINRLKQMLPQVVLEGQHENNDPTSVTSSMCDLLSQSNHIITFPSGFFRLLIDILQIINLDKDIFINILQIMRHSFLDSQEIKNQIISNHLDFYGWLIGRQLSNPLKCSHLFLLIQNILSHSQPNNNFLILVGPLFQTYNIKSLRFHSIHCLSQIVKTNRAIIKERILQGHIVQQCCLQILNYRQERILFDRGYPYHILEFMQAFINEYMSQTFQKIILPFIHLLNAFKFQIGTSHAVYQPEKLEKKSLNIILSSIENEEKLQIFANHHLMTRVLLQRLSNIDLNNDDNKETCKLLKQIFTYLQRRYGFREQVDRVIRAKNKQSYNGAEDDEITNSMDQERPSLI